MYINAAFTLCATNELFKYPLTDVQLWRAEQEKQVWRKHLAEAVGVKSGPGCQQSASSGGLKDETRSPFLQDAAC